MKRWWVFASCALVSASVAFAVAADDGFFGLPGTQGAQGPPGQQGPQGVNPAGIGINCGSNGLTLAHDAGGEKFVCNTSPQRAIELLATSDGLVGNAARINTVTTNDATLVVTGTTGAIGIYAENTTGTALSANARVNLGSAVLLPFSTHTSSCSASGSGCAVNVTCPAQYRAISGGCSAGADNVIAQQGFIDLNGLITASSVVATGYRCVTTSGTGYTVRAYTRCIGEGGP
jgi:hypothetical protein